MSSSEFSHPANTDSSRNTNTVIDDRKIHERLNNLPVNDIDALIANLDNYSVSHAGSGSRSIVFRLQNTPYHPDMTLKLFLAENQRTYEELAALAQASGYDDQPEAFEYLSFFSSDDPDEAFIQKHIVGHVKGSLIVPEFVDSPICIWARRTDEVASEKVGYSLPYIEGEAIKISSDPELCNIADMLQVTFGIYVGHRGSGNNDSRNAVFDKRSRVKKFIDVRTDHL